MSQSVEQVIVPVQKERLFGVVHKPQQKGPAVLFVHGFASNRSGKYRMHYQLAEALRQCGIGSLRVDLGGCGDSDRPFEKMTISTLKQDVLTAWHWLKAQEWVDSNRLGMVGKSLGAAIALKVSAEINEVVSLALLAPLLNTEQWNPVPLEDGFANIHGNLVGQVLAKELSDLNVQHELQQLSLPILHIHSAKDEVLSRQHCEGYQIARKSFGTIDRFVVLKEADHIYSRFQDRQAVLEMSKDWFQQTLR